MPSPGLIPGKDRASESRIARISLNPSPGSGEVGIASLLARHLARGLACGLPCSPGANKARGEQTVSDYVRVSNRRHPGVSQLSRLDYVRREKFYYSM